MKRRETYQAPAESVLAAVALVAVLVLAAVFLSGLVLLMAGVHL